MRIVIVAFNPRLRTCLPTFLSQTPAVAVVRSFGSGSTADLFPRLSFDMSRVAHTHFFWELAASPFHVRPRRHFVPLFSLLPRCLPAYLVDIPRDFAYLLPSGPTTSYLFTGPLFFFLLHIMSELGALGSFFPLHSGYPKKYHPLKRS